MQSQCIVIQTTCENQQVAQTIQKALISEKLAACVQASQITSTYLWQGQAESASEIKLDIKTTAALFDAVADTIKEHNSYDCPEIIALPIVMGSQTYLEWIAESTKQNTLKV